MPRLSPAVRCWLEPQGLCGKCLRAGGVGGVRLAVLGLTQPASLPHWCY